MGNARVEMYPLDSTFLNFGQDGINGRVTINRMDKYRDMCYSPFLLNQLISGDDVVDADERYKQCHMLGGNIAGRAATHCARPITRVRCLTGWMYFNQRCYYKFTSPRDNRYLTPLDGSSRACSRLYGDSVALDDVDVYTEAWLETHYLHWKLEPGTVRYRYPRVGGYCSCLDTESTSLLTFCDCNEFDYPICYYSIALPENEPKMAHVSMTPETARDIMYGHEGPPNAGFQCGCTCKDGWGGENCERATCPITDVLLFTPDEATIVGGFFAKCYVGGTCHSGEPRACKCGRNFSPAATLIPGSALYKFRDVPCMCPAAFGSDDYFFEIDGVVYTAEEIAGQPIPCNGLSHGVCSNGGCECASRVNPDGTEEPNFNGKACTSVVPYKPYKSISKNGPIVSSVCNNRGVSCNFGEREGNVFVGDEGADECLGATVGCVCTECDDLFCFGGESCTCPIPLDLAKGLSHNTFGVRDDVLIDLGSVKKVSASEAIEVVEGEYFTTAAAAFENSRDTFINGARQFVKWVRPTGCDLTNIVVSLSNEPGREAFTTPCTFSDDIYECPGGETLAYRFIILEDARDEVNTDIFKFETATCKVEVYTTLFEYCGDTLRVNPFAGRFYDLPSFSSRNRNLSVHSSCVILPCSNIHSF